MLNTVTGTQSVFILSRNDRNPTGVALDARSQTVWIAESLQRSDRRDSVAIVGRSGREELTLPLHPAKTYPSDVVSDRHGHIWVSAAAYPVLWRIDTSSHHISEMRLSFSVTSLVANEAGTVWYVEGGTRIMEIDQASLPKTIYNGKRGSYIYAISADGPRLWYLRSLVSASNLRSLVGYVDTKTGRVRECGTGSYGTRLTAAHGKAAYLQNLQSVVTIIGLDCEKSQVTVDGRMAALATDPRGRLWLVDNLRRRLVTINRIP